MPVLRSLNTDAVADIVLDPLPCTKVIGRHPSCDSILHAGSKNISGRHFTLVANAEGNVQIQDLSAHGTWVNGERLPSQKHRPEKLQRAVTDEGLMNLRNNDEIVLCAATIQEAKKLELKCAKIKSKDSNRKAKEKKRKRIDERKNWIAFRYEDTESEERSNGRVAKAAEVVLGTQQHCEEGSAFDVSWEDAEEGEKDDQDDDQGCDPATASKQGSSQSKTTKATIGGPVAGRYGKAALKELITDVPRAKADLIVGKDRSNITAIEEQSAAQITISPNDRDGKLRDLTISGTTEAIAKARALILELMASAESDSLAITQHMADEMMQEGGKAIHALEEHSGCSITLDQSCRSGTPQRVAMMGSSDAVAHAKRLIFELMTGATLSSLQRNTTEPRNSDAEELPLPPQTLPPSAPAVGPLHHYQSQGIASCHPTPKQHVTVQTVDTEGLAEIPPLPPHSHGQEEEEVPPPPPPLR